jgi:hypothetical protein
MKRLSIISAALLLLAGNIRAQTFPRIGYAGLMITNVLGASQMTTTPSAPVISGVSPGTPGSTAITITWTTDVLATNNTVDYGISTSYTNSAALNTSATSHTVSLSSLVASTTYHYRVRSTSAASGLSATNSDGTFTTASSGGGGITADVWEDFEFSTLDASSLAAHDHTSTGSWTVSATTNLALNTSGERATTSQINSATDAGTNGLIRYYNVASSDYIRYSAGSALGNTSFGFWYYLPTLGNAKAVYLLKIMDPAFADVGVEVAFYDNNGSNCKVLIGASTGTNVFTQNAWYWLTGKIVKNSTSYLSVYNSSGTRVETDLTVTAANKDPSYFYLGGNSANSAGMSGAGYFDDFVLDWTDATYPLGP